MNNVLPGWRHSLPATEECRQSVPMKRYGRSEEITATIAFLASEGGSLHHGLEHPRGRLPDAVRLMVVRDIAAADAAGPARRMPGSAVGPDWSAAS